MRENFAEKICFIDGIMRSMKITSFLPQISQPENLDNCYWFIFKDDTIFLAKSSEELTIPELSYNNQQFKYTHFLGLLNNIPCFCAETDFKLDEFTNFPIRQAYEHLGDNLFKIARRALQILKWDKTHQFCSQCGTKLVSKTDELAKICQNCDGLTFPKFSPSIIVAIKKENKILLARSPHFQPNMFALISGFIEPGETAEEAVVREVMEEVNLQIKNIRYFATQAWPFPDTFMIGFTADYAAGEIKINTKELEQAKWFDIDDLPLLPAPASISRQLIDHWITSHTTARNDQ